MKQIFVDIDGVVLDFVSRCEEIIGMDIETINSLNADPIREMLRVEIPKGFYRGLEPMEDHEEMVRLVRHLQKHYEVAFLSVCYGDDFQRIYDDKLYNLMNVGYRGIPLIGVTRSRDKAKWAHSASLLIDDRSRSCNPFREAGGHAIKHRSAQKTLEELKQLKVVDQNFTLPSSKELA